ncbi:hypothetical protein WN944_017235 [Citrus x changshan-huyou]|uniref:Uncharacterized protein n=1 Tax=Citrus x changshan-huyou TaxID=2935761 RepID=A0AAP0QNM3_9ROSI
MIALGSSFQYGSSSSSRLQAYPLMQTTSFEQPQPALLTLQNQEISLYTQDHSFHQSYIQTQLQLHQQQQSAGSNYLQQSSQNSHFYNTYLQNNPVDEDKGRERVQICCNWIKKGEGKEKTAVKMLQLRECRFAADLRVQI